MMVGIGILSAYMGVFIYAIVDYNRIATQYGQPDPNTFIAQNSSRLYSMAMWYEENIAKNHMPQNMVVNTFFNSTGENSIPIMWAVSYDSAEWTGHYIVAEAARYIVHLEAGDLDLANYALLNLTRALYGIERILYVAPNGGMARYAWPLAEYWYGDKLKSSNHYYGTFNGEPYIYEDDTSRDMHNGVIMGLGFAYFAVEDIALRAYIQRLVEHVVDYFIDRGWLYIDPNDVPNGTDMNNGIWIVGTNGIWTLAYLKVAALVNPSKYGSLYQEYAYRRDYLTRGVFPPGSQLSTVQSYYGLLLDWELLFILVVLETDPELQAHYLNYIGLLYEYTKWDRNALFNTMWLIMNLFAKREVANSELILGDVVDCLMRYYGARQRLPGRNINLDNPELASPIANKWITFFSTGLGSVLYPFWHSVFQFEDLASRALTPDLRPQTDFLWSRPPYQYKASKQNALIAGPSVDYTVVYWLARWANLIDPPSDKNAQIEVVFGGP
jgi:hypothetical protein